MSIHALLKRPTESRPQRVRRHIEARFRTAELEHSPSPHLVIERFFPEDVYRDILRFNLFRQNVGVEWLTREQDPTHPYYARKQINFHEGQSYEASPEARAFWEELSDVLLKGDWFPRRIYDLFPVYFRLRFGDLVDDQDFFGHFSRQLFLQRHESGYGIGPHTDIPIRVFTCIFSFAAQDGLEEYGTQFLAPKDRLDRCWGIDHHGPEGFEVRKLAPYRPNNFLLFFKTRHSFHSVKTIPEGMPDQRYGMQFQFYEPAGGLFRDLSAPSLMGRPLP